MGKTKPKDTEKEQPVRQEGGGSTWCAGGHRGKCFGKECSVGLKERPERPSEMRSETQLPGRNWPPRGVFCGEVRG